MDKTGLPTILIHRKAMSSEVLLAYEMNGEPLPPHHGFPLRVLVPGYIGARSGKWLASIVLQDAPSTNYYQAFAYKMFPPYIQAESADWTQGQMLGALPLNSVIFRPCEQLNVRAWDSAGCTQPEDVRQVWNWKGYLNNAWHRVNGVIH